MKKIIYRYLSGFAFGVMMLVLCLLLTYTFGGQAYYEEELSQILDPNALLLQTIWSGILYVCITITIINTHEFLRADDNDVTVQYLVMYMIHILVIVFVSFLAQEYGDFGLGVYSLVFGLGMIILMAGTLADMIQNVFKLIKLHKKVFVLVPEPEKTKKLPAKTTTKKTSSTKSAKK
ncbi:MAG: hypothetical protein IJ867_08935 [Clostridia bacterium]|nr:hypothetical protein [Clostridia bacterium]